MHRHRPGSHRRCAVLGGLASAALLVLGPPAATAGSVVTVYASPTSSASSPCTQAAPCRLDHAISAGNAAGDTVVVLPGTYNVTWGLNADHATTIEGEPGQPRPVLVGAANLGGPTLNASGGATITGLDIQATSASGAHPALALTGATAEDLVLSVSSADSGAAALQVTPASLPTLVRTVLATSQAPSGSAVAFKGGGKGNVVSIYNLTAIGQSASTAAVSNGLQAGAVTIEDSILSGQSSDVATASSKQTLAISHSALRPTASSGYTDQGGNISVAPAFVDSAAGNFREDVRSSTIDAGAANSNLTATDLDGSPRTIGSAPDMGAYEYDPATGGTGGSTGGGSTGTGGTTGSGGSSGGGSTGGGTGGGGTSGGGTTGGGSSTGTGDRLPTPSPPIVGVSVTLRPASGRIEIELPGHHRFVPLAGGSQLPVGTTVDATHGTVLLTSAVTRNGVTKTGTFGGSRFVVRQAKAARAVTALQLAGGSFAVCTRVTHGVMQRAARRPHHRVVRQLWGSDNGGSFTTIGSSASATVRGTVWLTQDRCDGTLVRAERGHVLVRDRVHHRAVLLGPGQSYLARARR